MKYACLTVVRLWHETSALKARFNKWLSGRPGASAADVYITVLSCEEMCHSACKHFSFELRYHVALLTFNYLHYHTNAPDNLSIQSVLRARGDAHRHGNDFFGWGSKNWWKTIIDNQIQNICNMYFSKKVYTVYNGVWAKDPRNENLCVKK